MINAELTFTEPEHRFYEELFCQCLQCKYCLPIFQDSHRPCPGLAETGTDAEEDGRLLPYLGRPGVNVISFLNVLLKAVSK